MSQILSQKICQLTQTKINLDYNCNSLPSLQNFIFGSNHMKASVSYNKWRRLSFYKIIIRWLEVKRPKKLETFCQNAHILTIPSKCNVNQLIHLQLIERRDCSWKEFRCQPSRNLIFSIWLAIYVLVLSTRFVSYAVLLASSYICSNEKIFFCVKIQPTFTNL